MLAMREPVESPLFDRLAVAVLVALAGVALMTFRDYPPKRVVGGSA